MGQSLAKNLIHLIFSTKERKPFLHDAFRDSLHAYIGGILKDQGSPCLAINSVADHAHILFCLSKNAPLANVIMQVKKGSSQWIKKQGARYGKFGWQNGYGAFSVSQSNVDDVCRYIASQAKHHRAVSFQDELRTFFNRHEMEYDERFIWG